MTERLPEDLAAAAAFHGHFCPGLNIGYRAAKLVLRELGTARAADEELVVVAENDGCGIDAIQHLTGCTLGKGNLIVRDWGKQVFTFGRRGQNTMLRVALRYVPPDPAVAGPEARRQAMTERLRDASDEELFDVRRVEGPLPEPARIFQTVLCSLCGEGVMEARAHLRDGQPVCPECYGPVYTRRG